MIGKFGANVEKDLTSNERFDAAIMSRAEPSSVALAMEGEVGRTALFDWVEVTGTESLGHGGLRRTLREPMIRPPPQGSIWATASSQGATAQAGQDAGTEPEPRGANSRVKGSGTRRRAGRRDPGLERSGGPRSSA